MKNNYETSRYLDLLKKTLSFYFWEEPGIPIERLQYKYSKNRFGSSKFE